MRALETIWMFRRYFLKAFNNKLNPYNQFLSYYHLHLPGLSHFTTVSSCAINVRSLSHFNNKLRSLL